MSFSSINDLDHDNVFINTEVTIGRSFKSRGWALSRNDIHEWIPVEKFEKKCEVIINNICAKAILRFNPRLFYKSDELSYYLEELYDKGLSKEKIPMKIKVNKNNFYSNDFSKDYSPKSIDTELKVGKSFSSGGWQLSKEVVSLLFPSEMYSGEYFIYIGDICSKAKLNLQFRLFYNSVELSEYLEELYYEDSNAKIPAKIVFEHESNFDNELNRKNVPINPLNNDDLSCSCIFCGKSYVPDISLDAHHDSQKLCSDCIEKIMLLDAYNKIKNSSLTSIIKKDFVVDIFDSDFDKIWDLLIKNDFLSPLGNLYKLNGNEVIESKYSKFLDNNSSNFKSPNKKRNPRIVDLINFEEEDEVNKCIICGDILDISDVEKCESCRDKALSTEYLKAIVTKVPYDKNFSKEYLGGDDVEDDLFIDKLLKYRLIRKNFGNSYKLNNVIFLNNFIEKYSDSPYKLKINYINDNSDVLKISKKDLSSEQRIDDLINWIKYRDYVVFKKGPYDFISIQFKQNGKFIYSKKYVSSFEAKRDAIHYLREFGKIELIADDDIKLVFE